MQVIFYKSPLVVNKQGDKDMFIILQTHSSDPENFLSGLDRYQSQSKKSIFAEIIVDDTLPFSFLLE